MRITITAPDIGCVEFATRALNAFIKGRGNGEFPNPSGAISNSFFGAECTEKPNGNYSIKCWREIRLSAGANLQILRRQRNV